MLLEPPTTFLTGETGSLKRSPGMRDHLLSPGGVVTYIFDGWPGKVQSNWTVRQRLQSHSRHLHSRHASTAYIRVISDTFSQESSPMLC